MSAVRAVLINLDRDGDRLAHMNREAAAVGMAFERVPAVLGVAMPPAIAPYLLRPDGSIASTLKRGEVGCYASHLVIHDRIVREKWWPAVLVLEDDLRLAPDLVDCLDAVVAALPSDWDLVRLSNPPKRAYRPVAPLPGGRELVRYSKIPNNTGAYLISPRGAAKFLAAARPRTRAIDEDLRRPWDFGLVTYGVVPPPIVSNIFESSIDGMEERAATRTRTPKVLTGRTEGPFGGLRRMRWNIADLGWRAWSACLMRNLANLARPRLKRGVSPAEIVARYRVELGTGPAGPQQNA